MKRALTLLAPAVVALGLVACGGDDDDDSPATTDAATEATTDETAGDPAPSSTSSTDGDETEDAATDAVRDVFPSLTDEQIDCLIEASGDVTQAANPSEAAEFFEQCDIQPEDLEVSIGSLPDELLEQARDQFAQLFPDLDDEQIDCLLDEFQSGAIDVSEAAQLAETCNIDPADLQPGG